MSKGDDWILSIAASDSDGLLESPTKTAAPTPDDRLVAKFDEIRAFAEATGRLPQDNPDDIHEYQLHRRLASMREDPEMRARLSDHDTTGVLGEAPKAPETLEEVLGTDRTGLLGTDPAEEIFVMRNVPENKATPEDIAERRECRDFSSFEPLFVACHADLQAGRRRLVARESSDRVRESEIRAESFFVVGGVLGYIADIGDERHEAGRRIARLRCVYENGTESNLLLRSLARRLYDGGRLVTDQLALPPADDSGLHAGTKMGRVYVLRSLSEDPRLRALAELHKIGSTSQSVASRIAEAESSPTFLNAPVEVVAEYEMPASAIGGVEKLLHQFFAAARIDLKLAEGDHAIADATEWFSVPIPQIDAAIQLIESGAIAEYEYDRDEARVRLRA